MGQQYVPVRQTDFLADRRNENGHNAAGIARRGARAGWMNEIGSVPYANAAFNYKQVSSINDALLKHCPNGIDCYFDNGT